MSADVQPPPSTGIPAGTRSRLPTSGTWSTGGEEGEQPTTGRQAYADEGEGEPQERGEGSGGGGVEGGVGP